MVNVICNIVKINIDYWLKNIGSSSSSNNNFFDYFSMYDKDNLLFAVYEVINIVNVFVPYYDTNNTNDNYNDLMYNKMINTLQLILSYNVNNKFDLLYNYIKFLYKKHCNKLFDSCYINVLDILLSVHALKKHCNLQTFSHDNPNIIGTREFIPHFPMDICIDHYISTPYEFLLFLRNTVYKSFYCTKYVIHSEDFNKLINIFMKNNFTHSDSLVVRYFNESK